MTLLQAYQGLRGLRQPIFHTADVAAVLKISRVYASQVLRRLAKEKVVIPIVRGRWAMNESIDPLGVPTWLSYPALSYVSLQTALYYHGMISQIPSVVYAVTLGRTERYHTPIGDFSLHHLAADFFFGYDMYGEAGVLLATPEKALLDICYISPAKSRLFHKLPELTLPKDLDLKKAQKFIERVPSASRRTVVHNRFNALVNHA